MTKIVKSQGAKVQKSMQKWLEYLPQFIPRISLSINTRKLIEENWVTYTNIFNQSSYIFIKTSEILHNCNSF